MAEETKQTLLQVDLQLDSAIQEMAAYQQKIDDISISMQKLTAQYKNGEVSREQYNQEMMRLKETQKAYRKEMGEISRVVQNQVISQEKYAGTLKGLCAELSTAKDKLRAMKTTDPGWEEQRQYVAALNEKIKEIEQSYGVFQRDVGHYRTEMEKTKDEIRQTIQEIQNLTAAHKEDSLEMADAQQRLEEYNGKMSESGKLMTSGIAIGTGLMATAGAIANMLGSDSEEAAKLQSLLQKLGGAIAGLSALMQVYNTLQQKGLITRIATNLQIKIATASLKKEATAEAGSTAATVAHTAAQEALNKSMLANPILLIVAAVVALIAGLTALVIWLVKSTDAQEAANKAMKEYEDQVRRSEAALAYLEAQELTRSVNIKKAYQDELMQMMKNGATKEELDKKQMEMETELLDLQIESSRKKREELEKEEKKAYNNYMMQYKLQQELIRKKGEDAEKTREQMKITSDAYKEYLAMHNQIASAIEAENNAIFTKAQQVYSASSGAADKAYNNATQKLSNLDKKYQEAYKRRYMFMYDYNKSAEENDKEKFTLSQQLETALFNLQQSNAVKKLKLDRQYGKITAAEYKEQMTILASEGKTFALRQAEAVNEYIRGVLTSAIQLAGGNMLDQQLSAVESKYAAARKSIEESDKLSSEAKTFYLTQLAENQAQEEITIKTNAEKEISDNITKIVTQRYATDKRQFSQNETEKIQLEIDQLNQVIAKKKTAGQQTLADEQNLELKKQQLRAAELDRDLQLSWQNQDAQYQLKKDYLEKEIELAEEGTTRKAEMEQQLADLTVQKNQEKLASYQEFSGGAMDVLSSISTLMSSLEEQDTQKYEQENADKKKTLEKRLEQGLISQEEYDKQTAALDEELEKKKAEIARKQAIRDKAMAAMQIAINTAAAIMRIWAEVPKLDFGVSTAALTAIASTVGAIQLAAVLAEPLPQARIGGLVEGGTHEQGGVLINTEGGERIISKDASKAFPELLNLISYIGKNSSIPDTGYAANVLSSSSAAAGQIQAIDYGLLAAKIGEQVAAALDANPPIMSVEAFERTRRDYQQVTNIAKI